MKNYQNGGVAHFGEKMVPEVFVEFKGDLAWWHNTMLDFVLLISDPNRTQHMKKRYCRSKLMRKGPKKEAKTSTTNRRRQIKQQDPMTRTLKKSSSEHY